MRHKEITVGDTVIAFDYNAWEMSGHEVSRKIHWKEVVVTRVEGSLIDIEFEDGTVIINYPIEHIRQE